MSEEGQSLLELIVVIAVAVIVVGALVFATISSLRNSQFAKNQSQATKLAQEGLEKVRSIRDRDDDISFAGTSRNFSYLYTQTLDCTGDNCYFSFYSGVLTNQNLPESVGGNMERQIKIEDGTPGDAEKNVTSTVSWTDFSGSHQSTLTTILRNVK